MDDNGHSNETSTVYLTEEFLGGTVVSDGFLVSWGDYDGDIAVGIEVVFVSKNLTRELSLFAGVPFWGNRQLESISIVWQEVSVGLWLTKHIGCNKITVQVNSKKRHFHHHTIIIMTPISFIKLGSYHCYTQQASDTAAHIGSVICFIPSNTIVPRQFSHERVCGSNITRTFNICYHNYKIIPISRTGKESFLSACTNCQKSG